MRCRRPCNTPANIFHSSEQTVLNEKLEILHVYIFIYFLKKKNTPVSMLCLPRGSSNSSPWPSLLNFPLYNLLNSRISMVTRARYRYASNILYIFAEEMQTQSHSCTTAQSNRTQLSPVLATAEATKVIAGTNPGDGRGDASSLHLLALGKRYHIATPRGCKHLAQLQKPLDPLFWPYPLNMHQYLQLRNHHGLAWPTPNIQIFLPVLFLVCVRISTHTHIVSVVGLQVGIAMLNSDFKKSNN